MRNKIVAVALGLTLGLVIAAAVTFVERPADAAAVTSAPVTLTAPEPHVAVFVPWCEDTDLDILCGYYDQDDAGVNRWWVYPEHMSKPTYRFAIEKCSAEDSGEFETCIWPADNLSGALVYVSMTLPDGE